MKKNVILTIQARDSQTSPQDVTRASDFPAGYVWKIFPKGKEFQTLPAFSHMFNILY